MKLHSIETGNFKLDGGAMFGVVPKVLWERTNPADSQNRIEMSARCLLIEDGEKLILIDAGLGNKQSEKFFSHYARSGEMTLESSLASCGFDVEDIAYFVYCNGRADKKDFNNILEFKTKVISYKGDTDWIDPITREIKKVLDDDKIPESNPSCEYCRYITKANL